MKKTLLGSVAVIGLVAYGSSASAQGMFDQSYFAVMGGGSWLGDITYDGPPSLNTVGLDFETGFAGAAAFGFSTMSGFRLEGELSSRGNDVNPFTIGNEGVSAGSARFFALMANGWYDFNRTGRFKPYIGGGIGVANVHLKVDEIGTVGGSGDIDDENCVFAYQLGAGFGYQFAPRATFTMDYRYFGASSSFFASETAPYGVTDSFHNHSLMVGLRLSLAPPPPPPP
ncbi:MAG: outer membrane beta-barrel protein [Bauldia sp.]